MVQHSFPQQTIVTIAADISIARLTRSVAEVMFRNWPLAQPQRITNLSALQKSVRGAANDQYEPNLALGSSAANVGSDPLIVRPIEEPANGLLDCCSKSTSWPGRNCKSSHVWNKNPTRGSFLLLRWRRNGVFGRTPSSYPASHVDCIGIAQLVQH